MHIETVNITGQHINSRCCQSQRVFESYLPPNRLHSICEQSEINNIALNICKLRNMFGKDQQKMKSENLLRSYKLNAAMKYLTEV